ncbi:hypothetical protein Nepgr_028625 [Nepenthes gracilis]|uniref:Uncharacterized protein n=1 Tax=Nepenthes gracilis TaxID=150966 RepID=A0AAD3TCE0_NEPGR|nr:hypothetical protein Nepgr_028625 [Nepenthes gracilis]
MPLSCPSACYEVKTTNLALLETELSRKSAIYYQHLDDCLPRAYNLLQKKEFIRAERHVIETLITSGESPYDYFRVTSIWGCIHGNFQFIQTDCCPYKMRPASNYINVYIKF